MPASRIKTVAKVRMAAPMDSSDANSHDFLNDHPPDGDHRRGRIEHFQTDWPRPENTHTVGIHQIHSQTEPDRHEREDPAREAALRGVNHDLLLQLESRPGRL